jgi:hypothetical protein
MQKLLLLLAFLPFTLIGNEPLTFTISPVHGPNWEPRLQVIVAFDGSPQGITYLAFQNNQFGEPDQMDFIDITQQNWKVSVTKEPDSNRFVVHHRPGQRVEVIYEVLDLQDSSQLFYQYCCYKPIIRADYFHVQSGHLLAAPEGFWKA